MSDVNANIGIHFDTANALAQLRQLQAGLSKFNQSLTEGNVASANAQKGLNAQLMQSINATGKFVASQRSIASSTASFTDALEKNKLSMGQYFKYTSAAASLNSKMLQGFFTKEKEILNRASKDRVKALQTQYVQLTNANGELVKVLQVVPKHLQMVNGQYADYATRTQMAAQRQQFLNQLLKQGSTQLLNFGKNTQWAGRQLMVGLTIPLVMLGSTAAKTFRDMEQATVKFQRVYGDMLTSVADTDKAVEGIKVLAKEFTKYGVAATDTMNLAAQAAAMGLTGAALQEQVTSATKLAVLGQVDQQQALETTISLQNAFGISSEQLAQKINFLNAVENQTVLSIEDLTVAIPKAGPVVKQLGGSVEDLAFFMTAMKEGGINASEGANALKSGLASMINPSKKASDMLASLGVNIKGIVNANAGDLKGTVVGFARALDTLAPLERSRAIEQLFGKFQFARLSTLFQNITKDGSQAAKAFGLAGASVEELAILSERELGKVENAVGVKFQKQIENLKIQLMPIGKAFLEAVTPIVQFAGKMLEKFNNLSDGTKKFVVGFIAVLGGIAPAVLMTVGLVANGAANLIKFFAMLRGGMAKLNGQNNVLGGGFDYLTQQEIENLTQSQALHTSHKQLIETFNVESTSVNLLATAYANAASQARSLASGSPGLFNGSPGAVGAVSGLPKKFASGGVVPGTGNGDTVPALLTPGEFVVTKDVVKQNPELIAALSNKNVQKFVDGGIVGGNSMFLQKERDRIANLDDSQLIAYASKVGVDIADTSKTALEDIRKMISSEFEKILQDVQSKFGKITQSGITEVGKKFDPEKGSSRMGAYYPKFDQLQGQEFSHVGQTKAVDATYGDNLNLIPQARNQVELIKKFYGDGGGSGEMPQLKVADAHGFMLKGKLNNAMSTLGKSASYEKANGAGSLGKDFQADFEKTGAEKWRAMTTMMGGDFDQLKSQAEVYDKLLIDKLSKWNSENLAKPIPQIFDDATFKQIESQVTADMQTLAPEFSKIVDQAKESITAIRISLGNDFEEVNAMLKANGAGTLGTNPNNAKILNYEARPDNAKLLGTMQEGASLGDAAVKGVRSKSGTDAGSPSKKAKSAGEEVGDGLIEGMKSKEAEVQSQSSKLGNAAVPTEKEIRDGAIKSVKKSAKKASKSRNSVKDSNTSTMVVDAENVSVSQDIVKSKKKQLALSDETVLAQQAQTQGTITAAELTQAASLNLGDSASSAEQINTAQQDMLNSSIESSNLEDLSVVEKQKQVELLKRYNAEMAAQVAGVQIPIGSQTNGINPSTALSSVDAYELASTYTRDKNGSILMDPETGNPTSMSKKQITQKKRGMRREKAGKYSGKAAGALGVATMAAGAVGAPPAVTGALGAASTVASMAPALAGMGPVGWTVAGIAALGAGAYMLNQHFNKIAEASAKLATATSATRESMKKMGELTGKVGASQIMDKRRSTTQYGKYSESLKLDRTFGNTFLGSDLGKQEKKTFKENSSKFGVEQATSDLALKLSAQVADGVLGKDQAESIAAALALSLKNQKIEMQVTGKMRTILGPDGEDLKDKPLKTRVLLIATARQRSEKALKTIETKRENGDSARKDIAALAAYNINNLELATMQADAVQYEYETQKKKLEIEIASTANAQRKVELETQLGTLNSNNLKNTETMNNQVLMNIKQAELDFQKVYSGSVLGSQANREDAFFDASRTTVTNAYKGTDQEKSASNFLKNTKQLETGATSGTYNSKTSLYEKNGLGTARAAQTFQAKMELLVGGKVISPDEANSWMKMFKGKLNELDLAINTSIKLNGAGKTKELFNMFSGFRNKKVATNMIQQILLTKKNPAEFDAIMETLKNLQALDGTAIDMEVLIKSIGLSGVDKIKKEFEQIEALKEKAKKEGKKIDLEEVKKKGGTVNPAIEALQKDTKAYKKFTDLNVEQQGEYLQKLTAAYAYQSQLTDTQLEEEAATWAAAQLWEEGISQDDAKYKDSLAAKIATYLSKGPQQRAVDSLIPYLDPTIPSKTGNGAGGGGGGTRDATYDDLLKRLRNVRLAALNAAGGFKELEKAIAASGSKAIKNQFNGLEQQLIKLGKSTQFSDYLAGLDQKELNVMGKAATKNGIDPNTGKKKKGVKAGDFILSDKGQKMEKGFDKAVIGDYNKEQLKSVTLAKQEIAARGKLLALGFKEVDIQTMLADENYKTLIATGKVTDAELKTNAALTQQARIRNQINGAVAGQKELQKTTENQKRIPEVIKMMQQAGMDAEAIRAAISDPAMLDTLITGMDNFATLAKDAQAEFNHLLSQINEIPERKIVEIAFTQTREEKIINAANAAAEMFDAYKMIDENTIKNAQGNTYASIQTQMDNLNNQAKIVQDSINITQSQIDTLQQEVDKDQRNIETNFTRPIEAKQRAIEKLNRTAEMNFVRPIQTLQDRSAILSHDLEVMSHAADQINEKYDKQQEALAKVSEINQQIIEQQQQQLGLADALSSGDISAAAKAVQGMRSTSASNYAQNADKALQQARQNEIDGLRGGVSGKSQKDIQEEQYQIGQQVYDLEQKKAAIDVEILKIQDEIYSLEQSRQVALDAIQVKTDAIAKLQYGTLLDQQNQLKTINDQNLKLQLQSDVLALQISQNDANRIIQGQTRAEWDLTLKAAQAAEKLAKGDLALALAGINTVSGTVKGAWDSIKSSYDAIKDKSITITQHIVTTYGTALGLPPVTPTVPPPSGDPAKAPGSAWVSDGNGGWKQPTKPAGDYGWDDNQGWVKGYYKDDANIPQPGSQTDSAAEANMRAKALEETARREKEAADAKVQAEALALLKAKEAASAKADRIATGFGWYGFAKGGIVPKYFASGGFARGTDTVPAMLTPGEFVMSRYAVNSHGINNMSALNSGTSMGDSVYNYNLNVSVRSDASPDEIARTVMAQIKQVDSQRIKGNRL